MNKTTKIVIVVALIAAVGIVFALKQKEKTSVSESAAAADLNTPAAAAVKLPRMVELGADKCVPCKMMAPILEELRTEYKGKLQVDFIDVWKNPDEAKKYKINVIPTQVFYDASDKELFRHEGFYSKEDILKKWKELGFNL